MAFTPLLSFSLCTVFNARSGEQSAFRGMFSNPWLWLAALLSLVLQMWLREVGKVATRSITGPRP